MSIATLYQDSVIAELACSVGSRLSLFLCLQDWQRGGARALGPPQPQKHIHHQFDLRGVSGGGG